MFKSQIISESPLAVWWGSNLYLINEHCMSLRRSLKEQTRLRHLLAQASKGRLSIDDRRLRGLVGQLIKDNPGALEMICEHREWAKAKGGVR